MFGKIFRYFSDARAELIRVVWPSRTEVVEGTQTVLLFIIGLLAITYAFDQIFGFLIGRILQ
jgi:preprotein translocase subunit SecE